MAAGLGFKTFQTGEVLTAADTNGYLMQGILVFATEAARNAAITSPQEGQFAFTKDTNSLWYYSGSAWVASGATGDIEGVTAGTGISGGGTSGTVTITNSMATAIDAKGDLVVGTGADAFSRLAVGTNGQVLTADSGEATGLKFATPAVATSGLTFIKAQTIGTTVTSVEVTSAFSATYDNYLITVTGGSAASDSADIVIKFGAATSNYKFVGIYMNTTSSTVNSFATNSAGNITVGGGSSNGFASFVTVINPYLTKRTGVIALTGTTHSSMYFEDYKGFLDDATSYTSFIISSSSNLTGGEIRVYGYQNS